MDRRPRGTCATSRGLIREKRGDGVMRWLDWNKIGLGWGDGDARKLIRRRM